MPRPPLSLSIAELSPCLALVIGLEDHGAEDWLYERAVELHRAGRSVVAVVDRLAHRHPPFPYAAVDPRRGVHYLEALATLEPRDVLFIENLCDRTTLDAAIDWVNRGVLVLSWCRGLDADSTLEVFESMARDPDAFRAHVRVLSGRLY